MGWGSLVTPVHACSHMGTAKKVPKNVKSLKYRWHCSIYPIVSHQIVPQCKGEPMGVNHGLAWHGDGVGVTPPPKNKFAQTRKKVKNFILVSS